MKHVLALEGRNYEVWLSHTVGGYVLEVGSVRLPVALEGIGQDRYRVVVSGGVVEATIARHGDRVFVHLDGVVQEILLRDSVDRYADEAKDVSARAAIAPMPGTVIATPVCAGDHASAGDVLVVIESMKLETAVRATHPGIVEAVHVRVGQSFERGAMLVSLARVERD
jgi:acetyl/propionyl-CoA carboxylase alpha subunit